MGGSIAEFDFSLEMTLNCALGIAKQYIFIACSHNATLTCKREDICNLSNIFVKPFLSLSVDLENI